MVAAFSISCVCIGGMIIAVRWLYHQAKDDFGIADLAIKSVAVSVVVFALGRVLFACYPDSAGFERLGAVIGATICTAVGAIALILLFAACRSIVRAVRRLRHGQTE